MDRWSQLSLKDKSDLMSLYIQNGISSLEEIKKHYNSYQDGGKIDEKKLERSYKRSAKIMNAVQSISGEYNKNVRNPFGGDKYDYREANNGVAQASYLMPKNLQEELFKRAGYIKNNGDYGLVKKAVGNRNIPVYQTYPDSIRKDELTHIGNVVHDDEIAFEGRDVRLTDPGFYPTAMYVEAKTGKPYAKGWDLNDYAISKDNPRKYNKALVLGSRILDKIGNPVVVTTGYQPLNYAPEYLIEEMRKKGYEYTPDLIEEDDEYKLYNEGKLPMWSLPPVEIEAESLNSNNYATGGHLYQTGGPDDDKYSFLRKEPEAAVADNTRVVLNPIHEETKPTESKSSNEQYKEFREDIKRQTLIEKEENTKKELAEFIPVVGDIIDASNSINEFRNNNITAGLAGLGMLAAPNLIEKPFKKWLNVLKAPARLSKNFKTNRNISTQNEILNTVWNNLVERESRETGVYRHSKALKDVMNNNPNMIHPLPNEFYYPRVNQTTNILRYMYNGEKPNSLKQFTEGFKTGVENLFRRDAYNLNGEIYINPLSWTRNPREFKGLLGHEAHHSVQETLPLEYRLSMDNHNGEYFINNINNKYTRDLLKPFERNSGKWIGSPEELDSEMINWKLQYGIPLNTDFLNFSPSQRQDFINKVSKRFDLENYEIENILNGLSKNQYFNLGGKLNGRQTR